MAQHDGVLDNQSGAAYRTDHNDINEAILTLMSGTSAPSPTWPNMWWADTTNSRLKKRKNDNTAWIDMGPLDNLPDGRIPILTKTAGYTAVAADRGALIDFTTAGVTLAYTAAGTLGADWYCYVRNSAATGALTHDPNSSETIDGLTTQTQQPGDSMWLVVCDGSGFKTLGRVSATAVGIIADFAGSSAPTGWLLCFGQNVSRTTYAALFAVIGTAFGVGDGSTTFGIPDLRGRATFGDDDQGGSAANRITNAGSGIVGTTLGASGGAQTVTLIAGNIPPLPITGTGGSLPFTGAGNTVSPGSGGGGSDASTQANAGVTAAAVNKMPPALIVTKIIYAGA